MDRGHSAAALTEQNQTFGEANWSLCKNDKCQEKEVESILKIFPATEEEMKHKLLKYYWQSKKRCAESAKLVNKEGSHERSVETMTSLTNVTSTVI